MKKCKQCGILSADTAIVCRNCNSKFTEDDKPIEVVAPVKKKRTVLSIITVIIAVVGIALFALYQTGMLKTWSQQADKNKINVMAEEFVKADFEKNPQKLKEYMLDQYITKNENEGIFSLESDKFTSFYFSMYNPSPNSSIEVLTVTTDFLKDDFDLYYQEINHKYSVEPSQIASVVVEVQISDQQSTGTLIAPMTAIKLEKEWFILPVL